MKFNIFEPVLSLAGILLLIKWGKKIRNESEDLKSNRICNMKFVMCICDEGAQKDKGRAGDKNSPQKNYQGSNI